MLRIGRSSATQAESSVWAQAGTDLPLNRRDVKAVIRRKRYVDPRAVPAIGRWTTAMPTSQPEHVHAPPLRRSKLPPSSPETLPGLAECPTNSRTILPRKTVEPPPGAAA